MTLPEWLLAGVWGFVGGSALLLGAFISYNLKLPQRLVAAVMAFGSGVLISALSFELMEDAFVHGGFAATAIGFIVGAGIYTFANRPISKKGGKHRKRSGSHQDFRQPRESEARGSGLAIALGALLDGIPESIVIGISLLGGKGVSVATVVAIFLSNIPESLSSSYGMKKSGRSGAYIFGVWGFICFASSVAAILGFTVVGGLSKPIIAGVTATAAGAVLSMIVDTMIPEAFEMTHDFAGFITVLGFLCSFFLSKIGDF